MTVAAAAALRWVMRADCESRGTAPRARRCCPSHGHTLGLRDEIFQIVWDVCLKNRVSNLGQTLSTLLLVKCVLLNFCHLRGSPCDAALDTQSPCVELLGVLQGPVLGLFLVEVGCSP